MNKRKLNLQNNKNEAKPVGVAPLGDPIPKRNTQRGITLLALIITIIVLLVLAMVSIRLVMNGGIIDRANKGVQSYSDAEIGEKIKLAYSEYQMGKLTNPNYTFQDALDSALGENVATATESNGVYTVVIAGGKTYTFNPSEGTVVAKTKKSPEELNDLEKYFFGVNGEGRSPWELVNPSTYQFIDKNDEGGLQNASQVLKLMNFIPYEYAEGVEEGVVVACYIRYNDAAYKVIAKGTSEQALIIDPYSGVEKVYEHTEGSMEGNVVQYSVDGTSAATDWLVLYDNGDTVDIMSIDTMGSLTLGLGDENATNERNESNEYLGKAINSYNNVVARINNYCKSLVTNTTAQAVRSVGSRPNVFATNGTIPDTTATYTSARLEQWNTNYKNVGLKSDTNAEQDVIRMSFYSNNSVPYIYTENNYWLASRFVYEYSSFVNFNARFVRSGMANDGYSLWYVNSDGDVDSSIPTYAVRPMVRVLKSNLS